MFLIAFYWFFNIRLYFDYGNLDLLAFMVYLLINFHYPAETLVDLKKKKEILVDFSKTPPHRFLLKS